MPDTPSETLIHFTTPALLKRGETACKQDHRTHQVSAKPGDVTCFACRKSPPFLTRQVLTEQQGVGAPTPLPQRQAPVLLKDIIAGDTPLIDLNVRAWKAALPAAKNERNMYVIEESIHHGEYRSTRRVEVYDINPVTVDAIITSSAYCYGSWLDPNGPYPETRRPKLFGLVEDLRHGITNRVIGWSTFRLITDHTTH